MRNVGFLGGPTLKTLGPSGDVECFFRCIAHLVAPAAPQRPWGLLTDRLYRRYVMLEDLPLTQSLMDDARDLLASLPTASAQVRRLVRPVADVRLDTRRATLGEVFREYFDKFTDCRQSAEAALARWGDYQPVRLVVAEMPAFITDRDRPASEYDALNGEPFWKR